MRAPVLLTVTCVLATSVAAQRLKEAPDVYQFGPPFEYTPRYQHDEKRSKIILNPDFWCSQCAKEGRIKFEHRDDMKDLLEADKTFPYPMDGKKGAHYGTFRLIEHEPDVVLKFLWGLNKGRSKNRVFIEDEYFRVYTDLEGFHTKQPVYPRREIELQQLSDIFPEVTDKTIVLNAHHRAHLYLIRAHRVLRDWKNLIEYDEKDSHLTYIGPYMGTRQKWEIFIFPKWRDLNAFLGEFTGQSAGGLGRGGTARTTEGLVWHPLKDDSIVVATHAEDAKKDVQLNNRFTHFLSYACSIAFRGYQYDIPVWASLGYAHLMERRERTDFDTFIFGEGQLPKLTDREKWKVFVRKNIDKDTFRPFQQIADLERPSQITVDEHWMSWSLVSFMMQTDQKKTGEFFKVLKDRRKGESTRNLTIRAFRKVWKTSITRFADDWKEWVKATYPTS